jgi:photosystem II stability/assembly factor-like uncharacterized protein
MAPRSKETHQALNTSTRSPWTPADRPAITINPKKPNEMYLSTMDGTIYVSADAGMKWKKQQ